MNNNICADCHHGIAATAVICPQCGAKQAKAVNTASSTDTALPVDLPEKWKTRFALIDKAGGVKLPLIKELVRGVYGVAAQLRGILAIGLLFTTGLSFGMTMDAVATALAVPAGAGFSANDWNATQVTGVKWQHKGLRETPVSPFTRLGSAELEGLGQVTVFFSGVRTMVSQLTVIVGGNQIEAVDTSMFDKVMKAHFGKSASIKKLRGLCKSEIGVRGSSVYESRWQKRSPFLSL